MIMTEGGGESKLSLEIRVPVRGEVRKSQPAVGFGVRKIKLDLIKQTVNHSNTWLNTSRSLLFE